MTAATSTVSPTPATSARGDSTAFLGMVVFMASWAVLFATLFFAYGIIRAGAHSWPPADLPRIPRLAPTLATLMLAASSALMQGALIAVRKTVAVPRTTARLLASSAALGGLFVVVQFSVWWSLYHAGLRPETGTYASAFYMLTVFHALHVLVGLGALVVLAVRAGMGALSARRHMSLRLWTMYWHMVGVIWGVMFMLVYVL